MFHSLNQIQISNKWMGDLDTDVILRAREVLRIEGRLEAFRPGTWHSS